MNRDIDARIATQNAEFDAVKELAKQMRRIEMTPVVDDDYPSVRFDYERAVRAVIEACRANGRLDHVAPSAEERRCHTSAPCLPECDGTRCARYSLPSTAECTSEDAACERAAAILRAEAERLEYPRTMVPQESEKIARRQNAFRTAAHYLDPESKERIAPSSTRTYIPHFDAWTAYCEAWRECFPNSTEQPSLSVAALAVFADMLLARSATRVESDPLVEACRDLLRYWTRNLHNFQWEKADDIVKRINRALPESALTSTGAK